MSFEVSWAEGTDATAQFCESTFAALVISPPVDIFVGELVGILYSQ